MPRCFVESAILLGEVGNDRCMLNPAGDDCAKRLVEIKSARVLALAFAVAGLYENRRHQP